MCVKQYMPCSVSQVNTVVQCNAHRILCIVRHRRARGHRVVGGGGEAGGEEAGRELSVGG